MNRRVLREKSNLAQGEFVKEAQASVYHVLHGLVETLVRERKIQPIPALPRMNAPTRSPTPAAGSSTPRASPSSASAAAYAKSPSPVDPVTAPVTSAVNASSPAMSTSARVVGTP